MKTVGQWIVSNLFVDPLTEELVEYQDLLDFF